MKFATYLALIGAAAAHAENGYDLEKHGLPHNKHHEAPHHKRNFMDHLKHKFHKAMKKGHEVMKKEQGHAEEFFKKVMNRVHHIMGDEEKPKMEYGAVQSHMEEFGFKGINIGALLACIGEEDKAALVADAAVQTLEQAYKDKSVEEAVGGVIALYAAYQSAVQGIPACKAIPTTAFEKELVAPMTEDKKKEVAEIMQGFMEGAKVGTFNLQALLECIYEADQAAEVMYVAISQIIPEAIKDKEIMEGVVGVLFMVSAVETFESQALPICEQVDKKSNWNVLADPDFSMDGDKITLNGNDVTEKVEDAFNSLAEKEYKAFGEKMGAMAHKPEEFLF